MMPLSPAQGEDRRTFELRFQSLVDRGRAYAFPCDAIGNVDMDILGERARNNYLYARALVGREVARPKVQTRAAC
jgi:hypothetical protein